MRHPAVQHCLCELRGLLHVTLYLNTDSTAPRRLGALVSVRNLHACIASMHGVTSSELPEVKAGMFTFCGPAREPARAIGWLACLAGGALTRLPISDAFRLLLFPDCT